MGTLYFWLVHAGARDGALGTIDRHPGHCAAKPLEGAAVAAQPGGDALVTHEFGVLVTRPGQCHHEEPGLEDLSGVHVRDRRAGAKVDLHRLRRFELKEERHIIGVVDDKPFQETVHGRDTPGVAVIARQCGMDGRALNAGGVPVGDLLAPGLKRRYAAGERVFAMRSMSRVRSGDRIQVLRPGSGQTASWLHREYRALRYQFEFYATRPCHQQMSQRRQAAASAFRLIR